MKHEIEIEGLPEGWEPVAIRKALDTDTHVFIDSEVFEIGKHPEILNPKNWPYLIIKKKQPRRIVFEETDIKNANIAFFDDAGMGTYWREVKETDLSLHNADDKESLRLSVDECKQLLSLIMIGLVKSVAVDKLKDFIKGQS